MFVLASQNHQTVGTLPDLHLNIMVRKVSSLQKSKDGFKPAGVISVAVYKQCVRKQIDHFTTPISEERKDPLGLLVTHISFLYIVSPNKKKDLAWLPE